MYGSGCQHFDCSISPSYSQLASKLTPLTGGTPSVDRTDRARSRPPMRSNQEVLDPGEAHWFLLLVFTDTDTTRYYHLMFGYDRHSCKAGVLNLQ